MKARHGVWWYSHTTNSLKKIKTGPSHFTASSIYTEEFLEAFSERVWSKHIRLTFW